MKVTILFIVLNLTIHFLDGQSPLKNISQILEFYNIGDYHSISEILKTSGFKLQSIIPRSQTNSDNIFENLIYIKPKETKLICRSCPSQYENIVENEVFSIVKEVTNTLLGPMPEFPYSDEKFNKIVNGVKTDRNVLGIYRNSVMDFMSFEEFIWSYIEPQYGGSASVPHEVTVIEYDEFVPFGLALDFVNSNSRTINSVIPYKLLNNSSSFIQYTKDDKSSGWGKYYYYYKNDHKIDKLISDFKSILQEVDIQFFAFTALNSSNSTYSVKLRNKIRIRNNRYYEDKIDDSEFITIYQGAGKTYQVVVELNGNLKTRITFDTGAGDVILSPEIANQLKKLGTLADSDFIGKRIYKYADGNTEELSQYLLKSIRIGNKIIKNIICAVGNKPNSTSLLGQSFLQRMGTFEFDYNRNLLIFK